MEHADRLKLFHVEQLLHNRYVDTIFNEIIVLDFPCISLDSGCLHSLYSLLDRIYENTHVLKKRAALAIAFPFLLLMQQIGYQLLGFLHVQISLDALLQHRLTILQGGEFQKRSCMPFRQPIL